MVIIEKILSFLKRLLGKGEQIKLLEAPKEKEGFMNSLKVNMKKGNIETLVCVR